MSVLRWLLGERAPLIRVHVLVRGRIGPGWYDIDRRLDLPAGTTLAELVAHGSRLGLPLEVALARQPAPARHPHAQRRALPPRGTGDRILAEGDQLYLLSPLAGG